MIWELDHDANMKDAIELTSRVAHKTCWGTLAGEVKRKKAELRATSTRAGAYPETAIFLGGTYSWCKTRVALVHKSPRGHTAQRVHATFIGAIGKVARVP